LHQHAATVHRIHLPTREVELAELVESAGDRGLGDVEVGGQTAHCMGPVRLQVNRQEHAELAHVEVAAILADHGQDRFAQHLGVECGSRGWNRLFGNGHQSRPSLRNKDMKRFSAKGKPRSFPRSLTAVCLLDVSRSQQRAMCRARRPVHQRGHRAGQQSLQVVRLAGGQFLAGPPRRTGGGPPHAPPRRRRAKLWEGIDAGV
jgi:hypothetical protein